VELIVMGKHRVGFVEHLISGSVAEKVLRRAPCPVLIVQHPEQEFVVPDSGRGPDSQ
jgi:nucleotide-binding universal stress UspA family protein